MTWSLQLRNGDLVVDQNRLGAVTGWQKLLQDLRCHFLERLGTDPSYPDFGSALDGGTRLDGTEIEGVIGETDPELVRSFVSTEVRRVVSEHQAKQLARIRSDRASYGKSTIEQDELLQSADINIGIENDLMVVQVVVTFAGGNTKRIAIPIALR